MRGRLTRYAAMLCAAALVLAGCGGGASATDVVQLTLLTHYGQEPLKPGLQELVDEWNDTHSKIQVSTQSVRYEDLLQTLMVQQAADRGADIVQPYGLWAGQLDDAGVLAEPPASVAREIERDYSPAAVQATAHGGKVLGYPTEVQTYALYVNKKLLRAGGVREAPKTWAELERAAVDATQKDRYGNLVVEGMALESGWDSAVVHPYLAMLQSAGGQFLADDGASVAFDSPAGRRALELEKRLIDRGVVDPGIELLKAFPSGKAAMAVNAGWFVGSLRVTMKDAYEDVEVVPIPGPAPGDKGSLAYGFFMGVNSQSEHESESWEFLRWLNAQPSGKDGASRMGRFQYGVGSLPGRQDDAEILTGSDTDPNLQPFIDALDYAMPEPNQAQGQRMKTLLQKHIEEVWSGQDTVGPALDEASEQCDSALRIANS